MIDDLKPRFGQTRLRNVVYSVLLIAAAVLVGPTLAQRRGRCPVCFSLRSFGENFDGVTPPALPAGWLATNAQGPPPLWVTSNSGVPSPPADTAPNAAFIDDPAVVSDKRLDSPLFTFFEGCCAQMTFRHNFNLEASGKPDVGFDGGVLEMSTDGGNTFQDILAVGGSFVSGGYNRTIATDRGSPIAGRQAWSGDSGGFITTVVNVPAIMIPPGNRFRWRMASDNSGSGEGWRVDTLSVTWCHTMGPCTPSARPTPAPRPEPHTPTPTPSGTLSPTPTPSASPAVTPRPRLTTPPRPTP